MEARSEVPLVVGARSSRQQREERWKELLRQFFDSDLGVREFCRQQGLNPSCFYKWRRALSRQTEAEASPASRFLRLKESRVPSSSGLEILLGRHRVRVEQGFDPGLLVQVMELLERRAC